MIVDAWIETKLVGSKVTLEVEIPDEELAGLDAAQRDKVIATAVREEMWNHAEWGWQERG